MAFAADSALSLRDCSKKLGVSEEELSKHVQQFKTALQLNSESEDLSIETDRLFDLKLLLILLKKQYPADHIEATLRFVQDNPVWKRIKAGTQNGFDRTLWISLLATIDLFLKAIQDSEELEELILNAETNGLALRSQAIEIGLNDVISMLQRYNFYDARHSSEGTGIEHWYRPYRSNDDHYVVDYKTGLMWQRDGSDDWLIYPKAQTYINELNGRQFAGFDDWRLPTLEEAASLMEPEPQHNNLHIAPLFGEAQERIWTCDWQKRDSEAWAVNFGYAESAPYFIWVYDCCIRAVRSWR